MFERESLLDKAAARIKQKVDVQSTNDDTVRQLQKVNDKLEILIDNTSTADLYTDVISTWHDQACAAGVLGIVIVNPPTDYFMRLHAINLTTTNNALAVAFTVDIKAVEAITKIGSVLNLFERITLSNYSPTWQMVFSKPLDLPVNYGIRFDNNAVLLGAGDARLFIQYDLIRQVKKERLPHS